MIRDSRETTDGGKLVMPYARRCQNGLDVKLSIQEEGVSLKAFRLFRDGGLKPVGGRMGRNLPLM